MLVFWEKEHLFRYWAYFEWHLLRFVRARAHVRAQMTQIACAVGIRNALLRNHLKQVWVEKNIAIFLYSIFVVQDTVKVHKDAQKVKRDIKIKQYCPTGLVSKRFFILQEHYILWDVTRYKDQIWFILPALKVLRMAKIQKIKLPSFCLH